MRHNYCEPSLLLYIVLETKHTCGQPGEKTPIVDVHTVKPPRKGQHGDGPFVPSWEVVLFRRFSLLHVNIAEYEALLIHKQYKNTRKHNNTLLPGIGACGVQERPVGGGGR